MPEYYTSCGWAPFGWTKQKADNVGACGPFTTRNDQGKCVVEASSMHLGNLVSHEYCKHYSEKPECTEGGFESRISEYKGLAGCEDTFLTKECAESFAVHLTQSHD